MQMLNMSCPQTVMAEKWDCLARVAGADVELFISLREDARFCPGKRGWSKWRCLARLAGAKFKKNFGGMHKKISSMAKKLKSKSKPLVKKIKEKAAGLVDKLKKKGKAKASTVKKTAKKAGKKSKLKTMAKAGAIGAVARGRAVADKGRAAVTKHRRGATIPGKQGLRKGGKFVKYSKYSKYGPKGVYNVKGSKLRGKGIVNMAKTGKGLSKSSGLSSVTASTNPYVNNMSKTFSVNNSPYANSAFGQ